MSCSWVVFGDHLEAGRQHHGTRWRPFGDLSTGWGLVLGLGRRWTRAEILVSEASGRFPEQDLIPTNSALGQGQVLRKGRASSRKRASTLRHHARVGLGRETSQLRACGDRAHGTSTPSSGPVEGVREQGQHGRAFGLRLCPRREKTFPGSPWGRGNTRRGQPGRLGEFPVG